MRLRRIWCVCGTNIMHSILSKYMYICICTKPNIPTCALSPPLNLSFGVNKSNSMRMKILQLLRGLYKAITKKSNNKRKAILPHMMACGEMTRQFAHEWSPADQYIFIASKAEGQATGNPPSMTPDTARERMTSPLLSCAVRSMKNDQPAGISNQ